jgi:hypothetical protein
MRRLWVPVLVWTPRESATLKRGEVLRRFTLVAVIAVLIVVPAAAARPDAVAHHPRPERNFLALLHPVSGGPAHAFGAVLFRQPHDAENVVFLDVWTLGWPRTTATPCNGRQTRSWTVTARERTR